MSARAIKPVNNNYDKQRTYTTMLSKYRIAIKNEFYFEAILIDYAIMEDRLRSFIYHLGGLTTRESTKICGKAKKYINEMVHNFNPKGNLGILSITGKMQIVRAILHWEEGFSGMPDNPYQKALKNRVEDLDIEGLLSTLDDIDKWRNYRNECIHCLMNKNVDSLREELALKVEEGMNYARFLDSQVRILKKGNKIRKSLHLGSQ